MGAKRSRWDDSDDEIDDARNGTSEAPQAAPRETINASPIAPACTPAAETDAEVLGLCAGVGTGSGDGAVPASALRPRPASFTGRPMPVLGGCRSVDKYERLHKIDEGTYGVVWKCRDRTTGEVVALKEVKLLQSLEGFPITSLREINILLAMDHENIISVREVVAGMGGRIFMVMDFMEHDLRALMESMRQPFSQSEVKCLLLQLLRATAYMHEHWVLHRDLKTANLLFNNAGILNVCDFGMARRYGDPIKKMTSAVITLWYRAPEILLGAKLYTPAVDMWSVGCIFAEMMTMKPLFPGQGEVNQLERIFKLLGTPTEEIWPGYSQLPNATRIRWKTYPHNRLRDMFRLPNHEGRPSLTDSGLQLLDAMLTYDPIRRITAADALRHPYFAEDPPPKSTAMMPTFPRKMEPRR